MLWSCSARRAGRTDRHDLEGLQVRPEVGGTVVTPTEVPTVTFVVVMRGATFSTVVDADGAFTRAFVDEPQPASAMSAIAAATTDARRRFGFRIVASEPLW